MIKFTQGAVTNPETNVTKDIVVKALSPNKPKDILIGGGMILAGIIYLTTSAFRNGSMKFEEAELRALSETGLI